MSTLNMNKHFRNMFKICSKYGDMSKYGNVSDFDDIFILFMK